MDSVGPGWSDAEGLELFGCESAVLAVGVLHGPVVGLSGGVVVDHATCECVAATVEDVRAADALTDLVRSVMAVHMCDAVAVELVGTVGVVEEVVEGMEDSADLQLQLDDAIGVCEEAVGLNGRLVGRARLVQLQLLLRTTAPFRTLAYRTAEAL